MSGFLKEVPSFTIWPESVKVTQMIGLRWLRIDQGALGHRTRKPTALASNMKEIHQLDNIQCHSYSAERAWSDDVEERIKMSKSLAQWAPGLCQAIGKAIARRNEENIAIQSLTAKEQREIQAWKDHYRCGHLPYRKDCPTCLLSAGKDRQHRAVLCPTSHCLSLDIAGPFVAGTDQEVNAPKYFLTGVYTVPINGQGAPLPEGLSQLRASQGNPEGLNEGEDEEIEGGDGDEVGHPAQHDPLRIVEGNVQGAERGEDEEDAQFLIRAQQEQERKWKEFIQERRALPVKNITFTVPLQSRSAQHVIRAVSKIYGRVRTMRLPILRVHTDRAREFSGSVFRACCEARDVYHTMTAGDDPASNARAEREVGWVKARARTLILAAKAVDHFWPLAVRQASEERLRMQVRRMGILTPSLLPLGANVVVKTKIWHQREDPSGMKWPMKRARLWGPASDMSTGSGGYYVQDGDGRFFRTTAVHQVREEEEVQQGGDQEGHCIAPGSVEDASRDGVGGHDELVDQQGASSGEGLRQGEPPQEEGSVHHPEGRSDQEKHDEVLDAIGWAKKGGDVDQELSMHNIVLEEVVKCAVAEGERQSKRRRHMTKSAPFWSDLEERRPVVARVRQSGGDVGGEEEEAIEQLRLKEHKGLMEYRSELVGLVNDGRINDEEVPLVGEVLKEAQLLEEMMEICALRQLQANQEEEVQQQVLQTRLVGMDEVRRDLERWKPAFKEEVDKLLKEALEPINDEEFRRILRESQDVECLPMKAVASVGPPDKYKARIVVCGNFAKEKEGEALDNAASGIDSVAIRTVLNVAAHRGWTAGTTDVSGAFLKAPRRTNDRRVTICEPPAILKNMKLVEQGEWWIIHQALYGLQESPGDWGHHRDQNIAELKWETNGQWFRFQRTSERHLWEIVADDDPTTSRGFLVVYVDDMMAVGDFSQVKAALNAIRSRWDCSPVEVLEEEKSMRFCGFELRKSDVGIILSQEGYTRSLLKRRNVEGKEQHPIPKIQEEIEEEAHTVHDLRQAQALVGEVLWLSTRSRPDISYAVGTLGRMLHKRPRYAQVSEWISWCWFAV